jgi:7-cyano-7-deazaguanine synthase
VAISLGLAAPMVVETPLMWVDKADTWRMARDLGGDDLVRLIKERTHTCYMGDHRTKHMWGFGCGECPACQLRASGYEQFSRSVG